MNELLSPVELTGREHDLKCWPLPFTAIARGIKGWEFRFDDRGYAVGDVLRLREWVPGQQTYTGRIQRVVVTYILHGGFGLPPGYVIMSVAPELELAPRQVPLEAALAIIGAFLLGISLGAGIGR